MELSPETCRVKPLRRINAIVASCWNYFTINSKLNLRGGGTFSIENTGVFRGLSATRGVVIHLFLCIFTSPSYVLGALSQRVERQKREADRSPASGVEVKKTFIFLLPVLHIVTGAPSTMMSPTGRRRCQVHLYIELIGIVQGGSNMTGTICV